MPSPLAGRARLHCGDGLVVSCATDPARPRRELDQAVADLHHAAANLTSLARQYREAADLTGELDVS